MFCLSFSERQMYYIFFNFILLLTFFFYDYEKMISSDFFTHLLYHFNQNFR